MTEISSDDAHRAWLTAERIKRVAGNAERPDLAAAD